MMARTRPRLEVTSSSLQTLLPAQVGPIPPNLLGLAPPIKCYYYKTLHHITQATQYHCSSCPFDSNDLIDIKTHTHKHHTGLKDASSLIIKECYSLHCYQCSFLGKNPTSILCQMRSSNMCERPLKCGQCDYSALLKEDLFTHLKWHQS